LFGLKKIYLFGIYPCPKTTEVLG